MMRTTTKTVRFQRPFCLKGVDRLLPPADYRVMTDEELIEGLSFPAYHRVSTAIFVPASSGSAIEMVTIDPLDLQAAQDKTQCLTSRLTLENFEIFGRTQHLCATFYTPSLANSSPSDRILLTRSRASARVRNRPVTRSRSLKLR